MLVSQLSAPQIHQFIELCRKQNSSLPIHDISNQLELLLKKCEKYSLKLDFYALNQSTAPIGQVPLEIIRDLQAFMLSLDYQTVRSGLIYICKSLIESTSQKTIKPSMVLSNQILIQVISQTHPTLFFGMNVTGQDQSPAKVMMKSYEKEFEKASIPLAWIMAQQSLPMEKGRIVHPKCMEVWYSYYLPRINEKLVKDKESKESREFLEFMLVVLQSNMESDAEITDLAVIPIKSILNLLKLKVGIENPEVELIYKQSRQLLCDSGRKASILTNPAQEVFNALFTAINDSDIQPDVLEIFARLLSSNTIIPSTKTMMSYELGKVWKSEYLKHKSQTDLVLTYLYNISSKNKKLWSRVQNSRIHDTLKPLSPSLSHKHLSKLISITSPPPSFPRRLFNLSKWLAILSLIGFCSYTLIYVQCSPTRTCPLPFNPQAFIKDLTGWISQHHIESKVNEVIRVWNKIINDTVITGRDYYNLVVKVEFERYVIPIWKSVWQSHYGRIVAREFDRYLVERLKIYQVWEWVVEFASLVRDVVMRDLKVAMEVGSEWVERDWPVFKSWFMRVLDKYAVLVVDEYLPVVVRYLNEVIMVVRGYTKIGAKYVREYVSLAVNQGRLLWIWIDSNVKSHPAYSLVWVEYERYLKEYVDIILDFLTPYFDYLLGLLDYSWKVLEGEVVISNETIKEYFQSLYSKINW